MKPRDLASLAERSTNPDELSALSTSRFIKVRAMVAKNAATPDDVLEELVADRHHLPRFGVAENLKPSAVLIALGAADGWVRATLARRRDLPVDVVASLMRDPEHEVRIAVAESTVDEQVLRTLARDTDSRVRRTLPFVDLTPDDIIEALSRDPDRTVRSCVVTSYRASETQLQRLLHDRSAAARDCLVHYYSRRPEVLQALANDRDPGVAGYVRALREGRTQHGVDDSVVVDALQRHRHRSIARPA